MRRKSGCRNGGAGDSQLFTSCAVKLSTSCAGHSLFKFDANEANSFGALSLTLKYGSSAAGELIQINAGRSNRDADRQQRAVIEGKEGGFRRHGEKFGEAIGNADRSRDAGGARQSE